jgi:hypothetical protein
MWNDRLTRAVGCAMDGRNHKIYEEAAELLRELSGELPPPEADASTVLDLILDRIPESRYERLANPHLRPVNIAFPKRPGG